MNSTSQIARPQGGVRRSLFWPERILGPRPGLREMNLVCWGMFVAFLVVPLCVVCWIQVKHGTASVSELRSDFVYLYGDGEIARNYPSARIYDLKLQQQVFNSIYKPEDGVYGPSPYPPFIALFFKWFTYVSFRSAFFIWLFLSLCLYLSGIGAAAKAAFPSEPLKISLIFCFALAFNPFLFGTLFNGQLATIGVFAVGFALYEEQQGKQFASGIALALLVYKFTLLPFLLLMLLLTRRFRTLLGFASGAGILFLASTVLAGFQVWPAYLRMVQSFRTAASLNGPYRTQLWVHLDLNTCAATVPGGRSAVGLTILTTICGLIAIDLAYLFWKSRSGGRPMQWLAWAAALTWTLLLNLYVPIYDSVLIVIAILLTLAALRDLEWNNAAEWSTFLAVIIFAVSWKTEAFAKAHGIQLLTVALLILGVMQLMLLHRAIQRSARELAPA
jgi:hypothetical protein